MFILDIIKDCIKGFSEGFFGDKRPSNIIIMTIVVASLLYVALYLPRTLGNDSDGITATCTVTKAYTRPRGGTIGELNDTAPVGVFETEECGTLTMITSPEGRKIPEYVATAQPGKKYLFHVLNSSTKKERDFETTRFEEIKE
ncbi:hypothetical protein [Rothia mucilaginosa]|uniref:hypothetical protein n=1 Tax=Rothia mucilaginosa TaxID=43675 RepID=UPI00260A623C|nr:hypothetical protein [Rothia mucilaginosa]